MSIHACIVTTEPAYYASATVRMALLFVCLWVHHC